MYMREPNEGAKVTPVRWTSALALAIAAAGTIYLGLFPGHVIEFASRAATSLVLR
jgi:hypothetical protein